MPNFKATSSSSSSTHEFPESLAQRAVNSERQRIKRRLLREVVPCTHAWTVLLLHTASVCCLGAFDSSVQLAASLAPTAIVKWLLPFIIPMAGSIVLLALGIMIQ